MATLTVIPYKPPSYINRKPSSKHVAPQPTFINENVQFEFSNVSIEKLQPSGGVAGSSNLQQKVAGDSKTTIKNAQASGDDLARTQGMC